jgi:acetyl esterase/lipase
MADQFTVEDFDYLRHGERKLMAKLFTPAGTGPFPVVIDLHGGAWNNGDLLDCVPRDEVLATNGMIALAINFRHAGDGFPTTMADINYAIRWVKANAGKLKARADRIGLSGQSSGGHLAMLAAMKPADPRYNAIPLPAGSPAVDATVQCVAMTWPVINPLSRYRHAQRRQAGANPPAWSNGMKDKHDLYWHNEANMTDANPMLILERGEKVPLVPSLWVQGRPDEVHDYHDDDSNFPGNEPERFVSNYRKAGGDIEIVYIDNAQRAGNASHDPVAAFLKKHLR